MRTAKPQLGVKKDRGGVRKRRNGSDKDAPGRGSTKTKKYPIVNVDDFGQSPGINRGIIEAHEHGIVTSASLMMRWSPKTDVFDWRVIYDRARVI